MTPGYGDEYVTCAGARSDLVAGTDHAVEALVGFFTIFGDGCFDLPPLAGLTKRCVRALAPPMGATPALAQKVHPMSGAGFWAYRAAKNCCSSSSALLRWYLK